MSDDGQNQEDCWICGLCGDARDYNFGWYAIVPETDTIKYACDDCIHDAYDRGGRELTVEEVEDLGLPIQDTIVRCASCGRKERVPAPMWFFELVLDLLDELGWVRRYGGLPYCPECKERLPAGNPWDRDIFREEGACPPKAESFFEPV